MSKKEIDTSTVVDDGQIFDLFLAGGGGILLVDGKPHEVYVDAGRLRFRGNPIVGALLDSRRGRGGMDMTEIVTGYQAGRYTIAQLREFYILIGYTLSGFLELSFNADVELRLP